MNILVLSASPHKHGVSSTLVDSFIKACNDNNHNVKRFDLSFMKLHPCMACDKCKDTKKCIYNDDEALIMDEIGKCDLLVLATPIYYYGMSSQLKMVIDRFYIDEDIIRKNQKVCFITAMADDIRESIIPTNESYLAICNWLKWENVGIFNAFECLDVNDLNKTNYVCEIYDFASSIIKD